MTRGYNISAFTKESLSIEEMMNKIKKDGSFPSLYWVCQIGESVGIIDELRKERAIKALLELLNHESEEIAMLAYYYLCEADVSNTEETAGNNDEKTVNERTVNEKTWNALEEFDRIHKNSNKFNLVLEILSSRRKLALSR